MSDLRKLTEAVEAGNLDISRGDTIAFASLPSQHRGTARASYFGSLNAAKALHEALLPGWHFDVNPRRAWVGAFEAAVSGQNLARAWLLAILKAYEATR